MYNPYSNSFVAVTNKKTSWIGFNKFDHITFKNTKTFRIPNNRI